MSDTSVYLIILAGGSGTRLWPLSRQDFPKQFLKVGSEHSLVRETVLRALPLAGWKQVRIVCGQAHAHLMKQEFPELDSEQFILEPCARNTAPAIALTAKLIADQDPRATLIVLPADHKIAAQDEALFRNVLTEAVEYAQSSQGLMTLGIVPTFPATGYGYIVQGPSVHQKKYPIFKVSQFREKPDLETAKVYLEKGDAFWNSGMFVWTAQSYLKAYQQYLPQDFNQLQSVSSYREIESVFPKLTSISVDYAILEKSNSIFVIQAPFAWDDVGALEVLSQYFEKDSQENVTQGQVLTLDASGNLILSDEGLVTCLGVQNLMIIKHRGAVLVASKDQSQQVKKILELVSQYHPEFK